jgi:hypothetical protein
MAIISNLNEGLQSSFIGQWFEWGQKGTGPFNFSWSLSTSERDLQDIEMILA